MIDQTQFLTESESQAVETAQLSSPEKFLTRLTISSQRLLSIIAKAEQCAIEDLSHQQIIQWFESEAMTRQENGVEAAVLKW